LYTSVQQKKLLRQLVDMAIHTVQVGTATNLN